MSWITTARLTIYCRSHGEPDGLPLLLLHGSFATSRWWEPLFAVLPNEIYAIAPDLRGCGQSEKLATGYTVPEQAEDVWSLVQRLGWRQFHLVGHSTGGAIALEFALYHADVLSSLILVDPPPLEGVFTPLDAVLLLDQMRHKRTLLRQALSILMPTFDPIESAGHAAFFKQLVDDASQMAPAAFTAVAEGLNQWNRLNEARRLSLPTLLIWGDRDAIVSREAMTRTLLTIPGANNLEVLHGVGHSPPVEAPLTLAEKIVTFISEDFGEYEQVRAGARTIIAPSPGLSAAPPEPPTNYTATELPGGHDGGGDAA
jgi:branched-chain amino acid transport system permease protein